jgi:hypothetical protein
MTIRKGQEWGQLVAPAQGMRTVASDAELRDLVLECRASGQPLPVVGLLGGDMMRTIGGSGDASRFARSEPIPHVPVDLVAVVADEDRRSWFVSHLVARRSAWAGGWWIGRATVAMNAQFLGRWDVAPRSHPNDGRVDVVIVDAALTLQQRWLARRRLPLGTHVPHPAITIKPQAAATLDLGRSLPVHLDGRPWGTARTLQLNVEPDALVVCV